MGGCTVGYLQLRLKPKVTALTERTHPAVLEQKWVLSLECVCVSVFMYPHPCPCICMLGRFKQGLPMKTLAALRSSQALMLKVCGLFAVPHP